MFLNLFALFSKITDGVGLDFYLSYNSLSLLLIAFLPPPFAASLWSPPLISAFPSSTFHSLMLSLPPARPSHSPPPCLFLPSRKSLSAICLAAMNSEPFRTNQLGQINDSLRGDKLCMSVWERARPPEMLHNPPYHLIYPAVTDSMSVENTRDRVGCTHWLLFKPPQVRTPDGC